MIYDEQFQFVGTGTKKVTIGSTAGASSALSVGDWYIAIGTVDCQLRHVTTSATSVTTGNAFFLAAYSYSEPFKIRSAAPKISVKRSGSVNGTLYLNRCRDAG